MRPDKKKTRHHDSVKCENKAKAKAAEKAKKEGKTSNKTQEKSEKPSTSTQFVQSEYQNRKVESNWTKYEIPSSEDENEIAATGPDFQFVLENASKSSDHLQLKAEKEWENKYQEFNGEFFALNLNNLDSKIDCLPWHKVLEMDEEDLDEKTVMKFEKYAEQSRELFSKKAQENFESVEEINKKIVETLKVKPAETKPEKPAEGIFSSFYVTPSTFSTFNFEFWIHFCPF